VEDEEFILNEGSATSNLRMIPQPLTLKLCRPSVEDKELLLIEGSAPSHLRMIPQRLTWSSVSIE
jgi:hypothetical protein